MSAPRILTDPRPEEIFLVGCVALGGSLALNALYKPKNDLETGGILSMVAGVSFVTMYLLISASCEGSKRGVCAFAPRVPL